MGTTRTIAKNTFFNFIATASDSVINLAVGIVLARSLGTEQYGLYSLLMWFLALAGLVANLGVGEMAKRFVAEAIGQRKRDAPKGIIRLTLVLRGLAALLVSLVILVLSSYWARLFGNPSNGMCFILVACALLPNVLNLALINIFAGFQKYEYGAYLVLGTNPLRAVLIIVLMVLNFGVQEVLILNMAVWVLGVFIGVFLLSRLIPLKDLLSPSPLESAARKSILKYSLTVAGILGVNYFLYRQAEVLFLGLYGQVEEVGFYTLACKLPTVAMTLIPFVFGRVLLPATAEQFGRGDIKKVGEIYLTSARYLMMLALPVAAGGIALARPIISLLYGAEYVPVVVLMQIVFIPFAMIGITHAATSVIYGINQPSFILKVGLFLACLNIGLNLWLIPQYGALGAAIGSSVPRILALPLYIRFASRKVGVAWPLGDTLKISLASLIMGVVLFGLETYLGVTLCLALSLPLGLIVYAGALLTLRVIRKQDLSILNELQNSLPAPLRKSYGALIASAKRILQRTGCI